MHSTQLFSFYEYEQCPVKEYCPKSNQNDGFIPYNTLHTVIIRATHNFGVLLFVIKREPEDPAGMQLVASRLPPQTLIGHSSLSGGNN
jgi:hypothetical protein